MSSWRYKLKLKLRTNSSVLRGGYAEFLGTFLLVALGNGCVAQKVLSGGTYNDFFSVTVGYGLAVSVAVSVSIGASGGHVNPAVTVVMALLGRCRWAAVPVYVAAQYLGGFAGAGAVLGIYWGAFQNVTHGVNKTLAEAAIFSTFPQEHLSLWNGLVDQIAGTAFLMISVLAITDRFNSSPQQGLVPLLVGLTVTLIGNAFGYNCGFAINPARDFGPRLFSMITGWNTALSHRHYMWFWVPIVGPHVGALLGALLYQLLVGIHWPDDRRTQRPEAVPRENPLYMSQHDVVGATGFESQECFATKL